MRAALPDPAAVPGLAALRAAVEPLGGALVAFSGGADSALVLRACAAWLPSDRVLAATGRSESLKPEELDRARALAGSLGVEHVVVETFEMQDPDYRANAPDRCWHCKDELYGRLGALAAERGLPVVVDGLNADDDLAERPGARAAQEHGVRSPLRAAGLGKAAVRDLSRALDLPTWDKPAEPCLSSRIPFGLEVTPERLDQVRRAEAVLASLGFPVHRVRHHGPVARIEVPAEDLPRALEPDVRAAVLAGLREAGFTWVTLDLGGYRSGSAHEALRRGDSIAV